VGNGPVSSKEGYFPSLFVAEGIPYVAYSDEAEGQKAVVKRLNGSEWEQVGAAASDDVARYIGISVYAGTPYIIYSDSRGGTALVKRFRGGTWEQAGAALSSGPAEYNQIAVEPESGIVCVAYSDKGNSGKAFAKLYEEEAGEWFDLAGAISDSDASILSLSLFGGLPFVAYKEGSDQRAHVRIYMGFEWQDMWIPASSGTPGSLSLLVSESGTDIIPYVACSDGGAGGKAIVRRWDNDTRGWSILGDAASPGSADSVTFTLSASTPLCAFSDGTMGGRATTRSYAGTWSTVGDAGFSEGAASGLSLAVHGGVIYCAYRDGGDGNRIIVKKYE